MLSYAKLWTLLEKKGMKKTDLKEVISGNTLAKLGKNEPISSTVIEKLCMFLNCQPGDIMEYVSEETLNKMAKQLDDAARQMVEMFEQNGISREQFTEMLLQDLPNYLKELSEGVSPTQVALQEHLEKAKKTNEE